MTNRPHDEPEQPPQGRHLPIPSDDTEWKERMDELDVEREELHKTQVPAPITVDPLELASIIKRLEELRTKLQEPGPEKTGLTAHLEEALSHLNQAASELAEEQRI